MPYWALSLRIDAISSLKMKAHLCMRGPSSYGREESWFSFKSAILAQNFFKHFSSRGPRWKVRKMADPRLYVISGRFFDPNRLGRAKFADLFLENESAPLHERCAFVFQTLLWMYYRALSQEFKQKTLAYILSKQTVAFLAKTHCFP